MTDNQFYVTYIVRVGDVFIIINMILTRMMIIIIFHCLTLKYAAVSERQTKNDIELLDSICLSVLKTELYSNKWQS